MAFSFAEVEGLACPPDVEGELGSKNHLADIGLILFPEMTLAQKGRCSRLFSLRPHPDLD
jgi:hypothetical protein